ncbi:SRPBCC family protein [Leifsonia shinshuensis]|uniref:SRPBCC family protein n=1 Tax=Leifsonia shinshuensis TaxID=150026 RepID=UPI002866A045|nr:SRPBCC family protein [Leifsonia shinshuensis]MDR6969810.1 uncharacterized protein YndB with AHSA1/START domain [Leifsonia shinshuensis]
MDPRTVRALIGTPRHPELVLRREYRATSGELRDACTSLPRLARWFGSVEGAPSGAGAEFRVDLGGDGTATGRIRRCDDDGLEVSWVAGEEPESILSAEWRDTGAGRAELTLRHRLASEERVAPSGRGWDDALAALDRSLTGGEAVAEGAGAWRLIGARPLEVTRTVDAEPERVWAAIASAEGLRTWWWRHWSDVTIEADVRVGGRYRIEAPGAEIAVEGRYLVVEPPQRLAFGWRWIDADGSSVDEAVDITLSAAGRGTLVTVRHTGPWEDDAPAESYRQGWDFTLGELAAVLAGARARNP